MKNVQIPQDLFLKLTCYHLAEMYELEEDIKRELEKKFDSMVMREHYTKYKTAETSKEREVARKKYLDKRGVPDDFRW